MVKKMNKKKFIVLITLLISFSILTLIGTTYALFTKTLNGEESISVRSGTLNIDFIGGDGINFDLDNNAFPMTDARGQQTEPYTFTIENKGDIPIYYTVNGTKLFPFFRGHIICFHHR